jgi:hypothetical protein
MRPGSAAGLVILVTALAAGATPAGAQPHQITRACNAAYVVRVVGEVGSGTLFTFNPPVPDVQPAHHFDAVGTCGPTVPNRCRQRASEVAMGCMGAHAADPLGEDNHEAACPPQSSPRHVTGQVNFRMRERPLEAYLENYVCAAVNQWYDRYTPNRGHAAVIRYEIHGRTWGDSGCGGGDGKSRTEKLATRDLACGRERAATSDVVLPDTYLCEARDWICTPNIEYRRWALPRPDHQLCRSACMGEGRCMAWQYDPPKSDDPQAYCKLVDHYPQIGGKDVGVVAGMK